MPYRSRLNIASLLSISRNYSQSFVQATMCYTMCTMSYGKARSKTETVETLRSSGPPMIGSAQTWFAYELPSRASDDSSDILRCPFATSILDGTPAHNQSSFHYPRVRSARQARRVGEHLSFLAYNEVPKVPTRPLRHSPKSYPKSALQASSSLC